MTYYNAIENIIDTINNKLKFPINIVVVGLSAHNIDLAIGDGSKTIDEVLSGKIPNKNHIFTVWTDKDKVNYKSLEHFSQLSSEPEKLTINECLKKFTYISKTKDNKYKIYISPLPQTFDFEDNGFTETYELTLDNKYEFDQIELPIFDLFKYQNLYSYKEENQFINAIIIEFIVRIAMHNNLMPNTFTSDLVPYELETEEEFDLRVEIDFQKQLEKIGNILLNNFGLTHNDLNELTTIFRGADIYDSENMSIQIQYPKQCIQSIKLDLSLAKDDLLAKISRIKDEYDLDQVSTINIQNKLSQNYLNEVQKILNKFPSTNFHKKQDQIIKALFIFDYIQSVKKDTEMNNQKILNMLEDLKDNALKNLNNFL